MTTALSVRDLRKIYDTGFEALKGISFDVQEGDFMALLGPNGAGKSTTIGIISSLVNKTGGMVSVFGHDIDQDFAAAKMQLGIVPQEFNFNQFETAFDILRIQAGYFGIDRKTASQRAEKYLKLLNLWDKRDVRSRMLSGGMKRRLLIARALVHEPKLLILDEPTAGVDIELRRSMWEFLREINRQGTTIILTTHYLEEAEQLCRNIAIIDQGTIIEQSSMRKFLAKLDKETLILDLGVDLTEAPHIEGVKLQLVDSHTLELEIPRKETLNAAFAALTERNIPVLSLRNKANRLEELFVALVEKKN